MSYSTISQNCVEKSFSFLELFQKNIRGLKKDKIDCLKSLKLNFMFISNG